MVMRYETFGLIKMHIMLISFLLLFLLQILVEPSDKRIFHLAAALHRGYSIEQLYKLTNIDKWFLNKLSNIVNYAKMLTDKYPKVKTYLFSAERTDRHSLIYYYVG